MNARLVGRMRFTRAGVGQRRGRAGQRSFPSRRGHCRPLSPTGFFRLNSFAAAPVTNPPSITNSEPVLKLDLSDTRNSASFVTSSVFPFSARSLSSVFPYRIFPPQLFRGRPGDESAVYHKFRTRVEARF